MTDRGVEQQVSGPSAPWESMPFFVKNPFFAFHLFLCTLVETYYCVWATGAVLNVEEKGDK
jgi:hypothetical protein